MATLYIAQNRTEGYYLKEVQGQNNAVITYNKEDALKVSRSFIEWILKAANRDTVFDIFEYQKDHHPSNPPQSNIQYPSALEIMNSEEYRYSI